MSEMEKIALGGVYFLAEPEAAKKIKSLPEKSIRKEGISDFFLLRVDEWKPFINIEDVELAEKEGVFIVIEKKPEISPELLSESKKAIKPKILARSKTDSYLGGVLGGLGKYFGVDPLIFRLTFVVLVYVLISSVYFLLFLVNLYGFFRIFLPISQESSDTYTKFFRQYEKSILAGVCVSLGIRLGVRVSLIRFVFVIMAAFYGFGIIIYLSIWFLTPYYEEERQKRSQKTDLTTEKDILVIRKPILSFRNYLNTFFYVFRVYIGFFIWAIHLVLIFAVLFSVFSVLFPEQTNIDGSGIVLFRQFRHTFYDVEIISTGFFMLILFSYGCYYGYGIVFGFPKRVFGYHVLMGVLLLISSLGLAHGAIKAYLLLKNKAIVLKEKAYPVGDFVKINLRELKNSAVFPVELELQKSPDDKLHIAREFTTHGLSRQEAILKGHNQFYGYRWEQNELILDNGFAMDEKTKIGISECKVVISIPCNRQFKLAENVIKMLKENPKNPEISYSIPEFNGVWLYECQGRLLRIK